ncbi:dihydrolipoamide acetyltransferase family protein [Streptomyces sp. KLOTTS4A1]|uniref:dihydrolipoamide acetyltransferase family protein n=1 Tax=Streptomyces sp. KLOTTS4A1 TaxID=3390996 RepID=UPI0039F5284E
MAQVLEFKLPDLGEGLTEAEVVRWLVAVGDVVTIDQPVVEVETAKAMVEVPCPYAGVVTARFGEEGAELPVGAPLLTVAVGASSGADVEAGTGASDGAAGAAKGAAGGAEAGEAEGSGNVLVGYGTGAAPARRRRVRAASGAGGGSAPDSGASPAPASRSVAAPESAPAPAAASASVPSSASASASAAGPGAAFTGAGSVDAGFEGPVPVISPLVRRLAREHGLDLREMTGSGPEGLILRADVESAVRAAEQRAHAAAPSAASATGSTASSSAPVTHRGAEGTRIPLRGVRGAVADKLSRSRREIPDVTVWVDADATELMAARTTMNAAGGPKISLLALFGRICTAALARYPELNSTVDVGAREIIRLDRVHLGFAAQTERGLVVPVVKDAHTRDAESLSAEFARLTEQARQGRLGPAELTGGTFTLNNYGVFGVDGSTPIINHPEAAMLGIGRIVARPWVHQGELAVRRVVQMSLTFDHRVCDGGTAGGFLRYVADCVEQPAVLLRSL